MEATQKIINTILSSKNEKKQQTTSRYEETFTKPQFEIMVVSILSPNPVHAQIIREKPGWQVAIQAHFAMPPCNRHPSTSVCLCICGGGGK